MTQEASSALIRAAQYVRKSTDYQRYSTENQSVANHAYAASRGMEIVRTYADEGKSGLTFHRVGSLLRNELIEEVPAGASLPAWRRDDQAGALALRITKRGLATIGVDDARGRRLSKPALPRRRQIAQPTSLSVPWPG